MKNLLKIAGVTALGALTIQVASAQDGRPFSADISVRGFYDDNIASTPSGTVVGPQKQSSYGFEIKPSVGYLLEQDQLTLQAGYVYGMKYYENRSNSADHSHLANLDISYQASPKHNFIFSEEFVIAQEAELLDPTGTLVSRSNGNNVRNTAEIISQIQMSRLIGLEISYKNGYHNYKDSGAAGSRSALLDRMTHLARTDLQWQQSEKSVIVAGGRFQYRDQTGDDLLTALGSSPDARDSRSYFGYLGINHSFSPQLTAVARAGVEYIEYPNIIGTSNDGASPFAEASLSYEYREDSTLQLGLKNQTIQTDVAGGGAGISPTTDADATTVFTVLSHKITPRLQAGATAQIQFTSFNGGVSSGQDEVLFSSGVNASYEIITDRLSAEVGYSYDRLKSDLANRSFSRNRVFVGAKASF
ncbi:outer membrane beta-barrel protein [Verrucomicrobia bacterium]|nr:outer membrane beta-barrel protein [Verrucomicrobiota bacterium]MDB4459162.1 outer membrane beta-barrel protein [bacterium]